MTRIEERAKLRWIIFELRCALARARFICKTHAETRVYLESVMADFDYAVPDDQFETDYARFVWIEKWDKIRADLAGGHADGEHSRASCQRCMAEAYFGLDMRPGQTVACQPPPGEEELAKLRWIISELLEDMAHIAWSDTLKTKEAMDDWYDRIVDRLLTEGQSESTTEHDYSYYRPDRWAQYVSWLTEAHCGDCTKVCCACSRCIAESYFLRDTRPILPGRRNT